MTNGKSTRARASFDDFVFQGGLAGSEDSRISLVPCRKMMSATVTIVVAEILMTLVVFVVLLLLVGIASGMEMTFAFLSLY